MTDLVPPLSELAADAVELLRSPGRKFLGVTGPLGAGKSTLTAALATELTQSVGEDAVAVVPMDGFHLANAVLRRLGIADR